MSKKKLRKINNQKKTDYHPLYKKYYNSREYKILLGETKAIVMRLRKRIIGEKI